MKQRAMTVFRERYKIKRQAYKTVNLADKRLNRRFSEILRPLSERPNVCIPAACGDREEGSFLPPIEWLAAAIATGFDGRHFCVGGWCGLDLGHCLFGVRQGS